MTWIEKLEACRRTLLKQPEFTIVFSAGTSGVPREMIQSLRKRFPFADEQYLDFLSQVNGLQADMGVLFGSGETATPSLLERTKMWGHVLDLSSWLPIGEDSSGSAFALNPRGEVWLIDNDPPDPANARKLASSFTEFLEEVLMGPRFFDLFDGDQGYRSPWVEHMKERGWM